METAGAYERLDEALREPEKVIRLSLTGPLPELPRAVFSLPNLEELVLLDCAPEAATLDALTDLVRLRVLRIGAHFTALPVDLSPLASLEVFQWRNARLTRFPAQLFQLCSLRELRVNGFKWDRSSPTGEVPESLGELTKLEVLSLPNTGITGLPESLGRCSALRTLELDDDAIRRVPASVGALRRLEVLSANNCGLSELPASLGECAALRFLSVNDNALTTLPDSFAALTRLKNLGLARNKLTSLPDPVKGLRDLSSLSLTANVFDGDAMAELESFTKRQRGFIAVDPPRKVKAPSKRLAKPASERLSAKVIAQIERLGGTFTDRAPPARPLELVFDDGPQIVPEPIRQLLQDVDWRRVNAEGFEVLQMELGPLTLFGYSDLTDEYEAIKNEAYLDFAHAQSRGFLLLKLAGNRDVTDPDVCFLDEEEYWATEAVDCGITLSEFLARGRAAASNAQERS